MVRKLEYTLESESELRGTLDKLYSRTRELMENNIKVKHTSLLEIMMSKPNIVTAIHSLKSNRGSMTPGVDGKTIRDYLKLSEEKLIELIHNRIKNFKAHIIKRVFIPKANGGQRPLGIPTLEDRIIQQMMKQVLEPILEAQFFKYSFGFRPERTTYHALERIKVLVHRTGYHWIVEGDIRQFFDKVNHRILIKKLWNMGIRDRRILCLITEFLKAGIFKNIVRNDIGTPQGGILSPLLANVYLHYFDKWVAKQFEEFTTKHKYSKHDHKLRALKSSKLKPGYLIRYADDWVLVTNNKSNAHKWKTVIKNFLQKELKLELSEEKTKITNIRTSPIEFLGFKYKVVLKGIKGKRKKDKKTRYISHVTPSDKKIKSKVKELRAELTSLSKKLNHDKLSNAQLILAYNSKVRGLVNYYSYATDTSIMDKEGYKLRIKTYNILAKRGGVLQSTNKCVNLAVKYPERTQKTLAIETEVGFVGIMLLNLAKMNENLFKQKVQDETPYSPSGRALIEKRKGTREIGIRHDEITSLSLLEKIRKELVTSPRYNFEYFMNRAYAFNRDKGKCRITGVPLGKHNLHVHHIDPKLPLEEVNKLPNLACVHKEIHKAIHNVVDMSSILNNKELKKLERFRKKIRTS
ncbi:group II intron reverse transcriptase/maturase [Cytobacillus firmus]|uniref:Group II intron reverse transcriptase/maturase n=2 Tax=Cytobacillus TaxID=2675230 RepID=A0A366JKK2_CYTFI|nr:group II intron reverse transcriptase/maturase [Cytobacillus firmus]TDX39212.1 group II intron reverse transcriptase/maturase [Cytobacillus oceanisediminis]